MRNLVQHHAPDLATQAFTVAVEALERSAIDRDLVGQDTRVAASPPRQRNPLIETKERLARWRFFLDDDRDIRDVVAETLRKRRQCILDLSFEILLGHGRS